MSKKLTWRIIVVLLIAAMMVYSIIHKETFIAIVMGALLLLNGFLLFLIVRDRNRNKS